MCVCFRHSLSEKTNSAVFDKQRTLRLTISRQGHRAEMGRNRPVCEKMSFCHRLDWKNQTGRNTVEMQVFSMEKHEHGSISATDIHPVLAEIPPKLWAKHKYDVGLIKGCEPVVITPKSDYRLCPSQCPLKKEALRGIQPVFESLLKERVIIPCHDSPVRTPIFPVKKITSNTSEPVTWRFVQDLQAVNSAVIARAARVPNPYTILSQIPQNAMYFTVVDLANAFFSVPVEEKKSVLVRVWFWQQRVHVYQVVSGLLWVSDDLQWSAQTEPWTINSIERNGAIAVYRLFIDLCTRWGYVRGWQCDSLEPSGERGSQGQSDKATVCEAGNNLFWVTLTPNNKAISEKRIKAIKDVPRPLTKTIVIILGNVCILSNVYSKLCTSWKALESPDNRERAEVMWQDWKAFFFTQMVDAVSMILQEQKTSHLSTARWLRYHTILLDMPNVTVKRCTTLNPATLLPTEEDGQEHHCCLSVLEQVCTPRPDLLDTPLENCDNVLFVDGSASKDPQTGLNKVGFAVTTEFEVVKSGKLPSNYSAQAAELVALTEACNLMADKCVTIYTDSRYAFGVTHRFWGTLEAW